VHRFRFDISAFIKPYPDLQSKVTNSYSVRLTTKVHVFKGVVYLSYNNSIYIQEQH